MEDRKDSDCLLCNNCALMTKLLNKTIDELKQQKELNKSLKEELNKEKGNIDQLYRTVLSFNKSKMRWW